MLAVVGGTSSLLGHTSTSCGLATLQCGGERRNLVSFTFGGSCGGWDDPVSVANVIAQESAHNLGLEHGGAVDGTGRSVCPCGEQDFARMERRGNNNDAQLGNNTTTNSPTPVEAVGV